MKKESFTHQAIDMPGDMAIVFTALSKHLFYYREFICKFVLDQGKVPLNPFMVFGYFMLDTVNRDIIRKGNNTLIAAAQELWVFGPVSDGVLAEIIQCKQAGKTIKYFSVHHEKGIAEITKEEVEMENEINGHKDQL